MQVDLIELLSQRPISHKTKITSASVVSGKLEMVVDGYPWWRSAVSGLEESTIRFSFEGLIAGNLVLDDISGIEGFADKALENFDVSLATTIGWAQPNTFSIYCSSSLKNVWDLYRQLYDYLLEVDSYRRIEEFLNFPTGKLSQLVEITSSSSFLLGQGPDCVRAVICDELERQGVVFNVLETRMDPNQCVLVRLSDSHFFCRTARAEFD